MEQRKYIQQCQTVRPAGLACCYICDKASRGNSAIAELLVLILFWIFTTWFYDVPIYPAFYPECRPAVRQLAHQRASLAYNAAITRTSRSSSVAAERTQCASNCCPGNATDDIMRPHTTSYSSSRRKDISFDLCLGTTWHDGCLLRCY